MDDGGGYGYDSSAGQFGNGDTGAYGGVDAASLGLGGMGFEATSFQAAAQTLDDVASQAIGLLTGLAVAEISGPIIGGLAGLFAGYLASNAINDPVGLVNSFGVMDAGDYAGIYAAVGLGYSSSSSLIGNPGGTP